jgi:hypothetical protein
MMAAKIGCSLSAGFKFDDQPLDFLLIFSLPYLIFLVLVHASLSTKEIPAPLDADS